MDIDTSNEPHPKPARRKNNSNTLEKKNTKKSPNLKEATILAAEDESVPETISVDFEGENERDQKYSVFEDTKPDLQNTPTKIQLDDDLPTSGPAADSVAQHSENKFSTQTDGATQQLPANQPRDNYNHRQQRGYPQGNDPRQRRGNKNFSGGADNQTPPHQQGKRQNDNQNKQKFAKTVRIGQLSSGQIKALECLSSFEKLSDFAEKNIDFSREPFDFNAAYEDRRILSTEAVPEELTAGQIEKNGNKIFEFVLQKKFSDRQPVVVKGVLETIEGGDGLLVYPKDNYRIRPQSAFIPKFLITKYGLRRGQDIVAYLHPPTQNSTCPFVLKISQVMGAAPGQVANLPRFKDLVPFYPTKRLFLESQEETKWDNVSMRIIDILTPIGLGQRGLIVAPPRTGKTVLLQGIANAISRNRPDAKLIILLIDERPEEVTDFRRQVTNAEIISSTFDESADNHVHAADMVIDKARRLVEAGQHVVILLDSITRLARAHNTEQPSSGKLLSGGVDANALQAPKKFFGAARNIEDGGSLTILATALVETGSRMDEVIFEEFKGTGNMELHLDRSLGDKRMFPALNIEKSGTRKEELLYHPDEMEKVYALRRAMKGVPFVDAMEMLIQRIRKTKTNTEFLLNVNRQ